MNEKFRLKFYIALLAVVMALGSMGFMWLEGWSLLNSVYFSIVTIATVGYGDLHPVTAPGKILAVLLIISGVGTFLGVIANSTEMLLKKKEKQERLEKLNMVIGLFFSDAGTHLLSLFAGSDNRIESLEEAFRIKGDWTDLRFRETARKVRPELFEFSIAGFDLVKLREFLRGKSSTMLLLMENPTLHEHELFTDLLRAGFHLYEELNCRDDLQQIAPSDAAHIAGDINRFYLLLVRQWLDYMAHLKRDYPYLFSLAVRRNPFDRNASPVVY